MGWNVRYIKKLAFNPLALSQHCFPAGRTVTALTVLLTILHCMIDQALALFYNRHNLI